MFEVVCTVDYNSKQVNARAQPFQASCGGLAACALLCRDWATLLCLRHHRLRQHLILRLPLQQVQPSPPATGSCQCTRKRILYMERQICCMNIQEGQLL